MRTTQYCEIQRHVLSVLVAPPPSPTVTYARLKLVLERTFLNAFKVFKKRFWVIYPK